MHIIARITALQSNYLAHPCNFFAGMIIHTRYFHLSMFPIQTLCFTSHVPTSSPWAMYLSSWIIDSIPCLSFIFTIPCFSIIISVTIVVAIRVSRPFSLMWQAGRQTGTCLRDVGAPLHLSSLKFGLSRTGVPTHHDLQHCFVP